MATTDEEHHIKGILKNSKSFEQSHKHDEEKKGKEHAMKWDEMNILATYHPADKDYGHMKIDEPPTPYNYDEGEDSAEEGELDPDALTNQLQRVKAKDSPRVRTDSEPDDEEDDQTMDPAEKAKHREFVQKRKQHYNEFEAVKLARKLIEQEDDEEEEDEEEEDDVTPPVTLGTTSAAATETPSTESTPTEDTKR